MKRTIQQLFLAVIFGLGVPGLILSVAVNSGQPMFDHPSSAVLPELSLGYQKENRVEEGLEISLLYGGQAHNLLLEDYLVGVVLQELPQDFHLEAKKAQATAARTYTLRTVAKGGKHSQGVICGDSTCCQAYISPAEYLASGGSIRALTEALQAVEQTRGQVILYDGKLIDATYFSCSGGKTEDAVAVWGAEVPYLQSVESPGEEGAAHFAETVQFTARDFYEALRLEGGDDSAAWLGTAVYTQGGGVAYMTVGGKRFTGAQLRNLLELRSTAFTITAVGDTVTVTTRGFGHRVGMSQYGAQAMALSGSDYRQILAHYYTGIIVADYLLSEQ